MKKYIILAALLSLTAINASAQQFHFGFRVGVCVPPPVVVVAPCPQPVVICDPVYRYYYCQPCPVYLGASFRPVPRQFYSHPHCPPVQAPRQHRGGRK